MLSKYCNYHDLNWEMVSQIIRNCTSERFRRQMLKIPDIKLDRLLELGRIHDTVESQALYVEGKIQPNDEVVETVSSKRRMILMILLTRNAFRVDIVGRMKIDVLRKGKGVIFVKNSIISQVFVDLRKMTIKKTIMAGQGKIM